MPRATARHAFEFRVFDWASRFRKGAGFVLVLDPSGGVAEVLEASRTVNGNRLVDPDMAKALTDKGGSHILYDPFDAPEYAWLSWHDVPRAVLERLVGEPLTPPPEGEGGIPETWGVMF